MRNHVITVIGRCIQHEIFLLDKKPSYGNHPAPIKITYSDSTKEDRINQCLDTLRKELEGEL